MECRIFTMPNQRPARMSQFCTSLSLLAERGVIGDPKLQKSRGACIKPASGNVLLLMVASPALSRKSMMKSPKLRIVSMAILLAVLGIQMSAQEQKKHHRRYKFVDLGTPGGPHSYGSVNGDGFGLLNNSGVGRGRSLLLDIPFYRTH